MHTNFTVSDLLRSAQAFALMPLFLFVPGYVLGWLLRVLDFRRRSFPEQVLIATPLSLALCPIATYRLGLSASMAAVWVFYGCCWALCPVLLALRARTVRRSELRLSRYTWIALAIVAAWCLVLLLSLVDLQIHDRLYSSVAANDYGFRVPITQALAREGLPGFNPFFYPGHQVPLRYHYFWMLLCSLPVRLFGIRALHAMWGATPWCAIGLLSMIPLFLKFVFTPAANLRRQAVIGMFLLAVTGLDIIPTAANFVSMPLQIQGDMEWWNEQVASWMDSVLWNPHHVSALIVCLLGFLLLWNALRSTWRDRIVAVLLSAAAFATASGLSVFVTFTFALFMAAWLLFTLRQKQWLTAALQCLSGILAVCFALPLLKVLLAPAGAGGGFAKFGVRPFHTAIVVLQLFGVNSPGAFAAVSLFSLPLSYFFELGIFGVVALFRLRDVCRKPQPLSEAEKVSWIMVLVSLLIATFMQSSVAVNPNDLGWRSFLPFQFITLLWAIPLVESWLDRAQNKAFQVPASGPLAIRHSWLVALLLLGFLGTIYQLVCLRTYAIGVEKGALLAPPWLEDDRNLGRRQFAIRELYETLHTKLPPDVIVQQNPISRHWTEHLLYNERQRVAGVPGCGVNFGGDIRECMGTMQRTFNLYRIPNSIRDLDSVCRALSIDVVVATDLDYVWADRRSWVWRTTPIAGNSFARAIACGESSKLSAKVGN
ncbi:MAG: hypothetical protein ACLP6G_19875 [Terriglobales bacterium]